MKELPLWYSKSTSRWSLTTFRYARSIYAPSSPRIWHSFVVIQTYVQAANFRVRAVGFAAMCHIRIRRSSFRSATGGPSAAQSDAWRQKQFLGGYGRPTVENLGVVKNLKLTI